VQVTITATTINQLVNADYIGVDQLAALNPQSRDEILKALMSTLSKKSQSLAEQPSMVSSDQMRDLAKATKSTTDELSKPGLDAEARKSHLGKLFENFRTYFGDATDIVLAAVKVAQATGLLDR